jgi:hypothetical protein
MSDDRHMILVDASMLATNVGFLSAAVALHVVRDYLVRTDKQTALEALELAIELTPNPFEVPKIEPEVEGMYYFKANLEILLEATTKRVLEE